MAAQSLLAKLGMRSAFLGTAASLALAAPIAAGDQSMSAHTAADRIGIYFDRTTPGSEFMGVVAGGVDALHAGKTLVAVSVGISANRSSVAGNEIFGLNAGNTGMIFGNNTIVGANAGTAMTNGLENVLVGSSAMANSVSGLSCVAVGYQALMNSDNEGTVAIGYQAALLAVDCRRTVAIGYKAFATAASGAHDCVAVGFEWMNQATGVSNTAVGCQAGLVLTTGEENVLVGHRAGELMIDGSGNTAIGQMAGATTVSGYGNIFLGVHAGDYTDASAANRCVIGSDWYEIEEVFIGNGEVNPSPNAFYFRATGGSGNDVAGANMHLGGGISTGTGIGGDIVFETCPAGAVSGALANFTNPRVRITYDGSLELVGLPTASAPAVSGGSGDARLYGDSDQSLLMVSVSNSPYRPMSFYGADWLVEVTDASTVQVSAGDAKFFHVELTDSRTLQIINEPANTNLEQVIVLEVEQGGTGSYTLTQDATVAVSTALPWPSLSTAVGAIDVLTFKYSRAKAKWLLVAFVSGF